MQKNNYGNKKKNAVKEDAPIMRSVIIAPRSSAGGVGLGLGLVGAHPKMPKSRPIQRPMQCTAVPKSIPLGSASTLRRDSPSPSMGIPLPKKMGFGKATTSCKQTVGATEDSWNVTQLISVPGFHILERTHVYVSDTNPSQVTSRIAAFLKNQSIAANYDSANACAYAETEDQVEFVVRLFQHSASKILVEVQKVKGCSFGYCQVAKTLLNAAKGDAEVQSSQSRTTATPFTFKLPPTQARQLNNDRDKIVDDCLEHAMNLLKSNRLDSDLLAMESLSLVTSSTCLDRTCAAQKILCGPLLDNLSRLIKCSSSKTESNDSESGDAFEDDNCSIMRRKALLILAKCLELVEKSGQLASIIQKDHFQRCDNDELLPALIHELKMASMKPHDACYAARCLQSLVRSSPQIRSRACQLDITGAATCAARTGSMSHFLLEAESSQLREILLRN